MNPQADLDAPYIHPQAWVHPSVKLGKRTKIWQFASIFADVVIGDDCAIGPASYVGTATRLGNNVRTQHAVHITDHATVGNNVFFGPGVMSTNDRHPIAGNKGFTREDLVIEDNVSIGAAVSILPGVTIHKGAMIGTGATIVKDVPADVILIGPPAMPVQEYREWRIIKDKICRMFAAALREWRD